MCRRLGVTFSKLGDCVSISMAHLKALESPVEILGIFAFIQKKQPAGNWLLKEILFTLEE